MGVLLMLLAVGLVWTVEGTKYLLVTVVLCWLAYGLFCAATRGGSQ